MIHGPMPSRLRRVIALPVAFGIVGLLAGGVAHALTAHNTGVRGVVLFAGDSNLTLTAAELTNTLTWGSHADNGYVPVFGSKVGTAVRYPDCLVTAGCTTYDYWKRRLALILAKVDPSIIVTDLGINDSGKVGTPTTTGYSSYGAKIDWWMGLIPSTKRVLWTNLPCDVEPSAMRTGCQAVNAALKQADARWANLSVLDWASKANTHPEYMVVPGSNVHLSASGRTAYAQFVVAALDTRFPVPSS